MYAKMYQSSLAHFLTYLIDCTQDIWGLHAIVWLHASAIEVSNVATVDISGSISYIHMAISHV